MSRRASNDSTKSASSTGNPPVSRKSGKSAKYDSSEFNWDKYLQLTGMQAAPIECFKQDNSNEPLENKFELYQKIEAKDARNPSAISVATIVQMQGPRLCLRLDGTDGCNDFWRLVNNKDIFPLGTCEAHGGLLQPPLGYTRTVWTWPVFLQKTLQGANHPGTDAFLLEPEGPEKNLFKVGMKLEAVDSKNPQLICPATIGEVDGDQVFVSFDGWRGAFDYWCNFDSRELFPVGWCQANNHPLQAAGRKGDNPVVVEKLKQVAEENKRQTRSGKNNQEVKAILTKVEVPIHTREKPPRRRAVEKITRSKQDKCDSPSPLTQVETSSPSSEPSTKMATSDWSVSSGDSDSSQDRAATQDGAAEIEELRARVDRTGEEEGEVVAMDAELSLKTEETPESTPNKDSILLQVSSEERRRWERKVWKQKHKPHRRLARALKRLVEEGSSTPGQIALLTSSQRKRHAALIDGDCLKIKKKKKKKKILDSSYPRLEGFGLKGSEASTTSTTPSMTKPTSPSFLDVSDTPTSLFGEPLFGNKATIVRSATQGWPTHLQIGSVVTSDNKLGRFDKIPTTFTSPSKLSDADDEAANESTVTVTQCVSTTTTDALLSISSEAATDMKCSTPPPSVSSTSQIVKKETSKVEEGNNEAVSSTTNPPSRPPSLPTFDPQPSTSSNLVTSSRHVEKRRPSNPSKWTIYDVTAYVRDKEPALHQHLHLLEKHEIDGAAFLLLNSNNIVKYMQLKLGPALKLSSIVEDLKQTISRRLKKK